jgi:sialate O-acetylesterase
MKKINYIVLFILTSTSLFANYLPDNYMEVINLKGMWKFNIGDNKSWAQPNFNDAEWESIYVPSSWENQGFPGYDGYAWYRKEIVISGETQNNNLVLLLGYIDDVDEVFFNGVKIGQKGAFPPKFWTAYTAERKYEIPKELIKPNQKNTIAVRVYDAQLDGGILHGNIGIYIDKNQMPFDLKLEGYWNFKQGDNKEWIAPDYIDNDWGKILVPGTWEDQVSRNYDGFGWYRKQFKMEGSTAPKRYVLIMGKIDDLDEVYLNGKLVGSTGKMYDNAYQNRASNEYQQIRYYYLNSDAVYTNKTNTIAVRVFDARETGGIYAGPVGLIELKTFVNYNRNKRNNASW